MAKVASRTSDDLRLSSEAPPASVVAALSVYLEPLAADARVAVLGDAELGLFEAILELGARTVHLYDPDPDRVSRMADDVPRGVSVRMLRDDFDVRDGAFDLVVIPDVGVLPDVATTIVRLRRVVDPRGAVIAMGRARTADSDPGIFPELAAASIEYAELYDLFALQFENVTMTGVLPFTGVVFAELGAGDDLAVSVDTRLVDPEPPGVFVVTASREEEPILDPYAIVQIARPETPLAPTELVRAIAPAVREIEDERLVETAAAFAAAHLKAEMLAQQLDDQRVRLAATEQRAIELEGIVNVAQQALGVLEARLLYAEQGLLERDDRIAMLTAEMEAEASRIENAATTTQLVDPARMSALVRRAEDAEADLAHLMTTHSAETSAAEDQLRERAGVISTLQKEVDRREALVRELVTSLEEARDGTAAPLVFEAAPEPIGIPVEEAARLRRKLDELALEVARRDGELAAQGWSVTELTNEKRAIEAELLRLKSHVPLTSGNLERDLAAARDEIDALRQALTQEHAARIAAESGEELLRARAELARQAVLLQQAERS